MAKVAKLVTFSFVTRVIVNEDATEEQIVAASKQGILNSVNNDELYDNLEKYEDDDEMPFIENSVENLKAIFPKKAYITQEIIDEANIYNGSKCIGARTLDKIMPDDLKGISRWGSYHGVLNEHKENQVIIGTEEEVDMMEIKEPQFVTFIVKS